MSGWELAIVLAVASAPAMLAIGAIAWFCARANRRVHDLCRDLLKANLATSDRPAPPQLAAAMEITDRVEREQERYPVPTQRRVPAGAS